MLNDFKFLNNNYNKFKPSIFSSLSLNTRSFSTSTRISNNNNDPDLDNLDYNSDESLWKKKIIRDFKKAYGGGYLGYKKIESFGNVSQFVDTIDPKNFQMDIIPQIINLFDEKRLENIKNLSLKLKFYVIEIPENITYSILPVLRWETSIGEFKTISISDSLKITRNINTELIAEKFIHEIIDILREYSLRDVDLELLIMGRPWLSVDEFNIDKYLDRKFLDDVFKWCNRKKKISPWSKPFDVKVPLDKIARLKNYLYKDIIMDNYGDPVYNKDNDLIGYKMNENKYCSVYTYSNIDNLICNKLLIRDLDKINLLFKGEVIDSWTDTKTESGFVREYNRSKYYIL